LRLFLYITSHDSKFCCFRMDNFPRLNSLNGGFSPDLFSLLLIQFFLPIFVVHLIQNKINRPFENRNETKMNSVQEIVITGLSFENDFTVIICKQNYGRHLNISHYCGAHAINFWHRIIFCL
jgi:hypothetical protein